MVTGIFRSDTIAFDSHKLTNSDIGKAYPDIFLVKYNGNGKVLWAKCGNGAKNGDYTTGVAIDNSGNSFITGNFNSFTIKFDTATLKRMGSYPDIFITKYDSNGALVWAKNKGQVSMEAYANCISSDAAGNIFIAGAYKGSGIKFDTLGLKGGNWTDQDAYAAGFTNDGNVIWLQGAGGRLGTEGINSISNGLNGNVYVVGYFNATAYFGKDSFISFTSNYDMFLAKINYGNISAVQNAEPFNSKEIATLYPKPTHQTITINTQQIIQKTEV
ncbi:MAG: SBBP repeat-containing protein, partial [Bacteroidetes bacterium]|nr:SBBP repeat-containing protein [Bacteroidota bacterium]